MTEIDIIGTAPLFMGLPEADLAEIRRIAVTRTYQRNETIFLEGDPGDGFYIVGEGQVKVYKMSPEGKEQILHILGPGKPFGEVPVFSGDNFPANAQALTAARIVFIPRPAFIELIHLHPSLAMNMLAVLSRRLRQFTAQIESLSLKEVPARLADYLLYLAEEQDAPEEITLSISKGQLASLLGTIPETLSRILAKMTGAGLISVSGRTITLLDPDGLADLSEGGRLE